MTAAPCIRGEAPPETCWTVRARMWAATSAGRRRVPADRTSLDPLARFVDGLLVAIERGAPLAEVLRAQAADVREAGKRRLLEAGVRK